MQRETKCIFCGKYRKIFYFGMCQTCYKKNSYEKKKTTKYKLINEPKNEIQRKILKLFLVENKTRKEIYNIIKQESNNSHSYRYICQVICENTKKEVN